MKILLISCLPIGHTGYGNQSLFLYENLKKEHNFIFYGVDVNIETETTIYKYVKSKNNTQYVNFLSNNANYKMDDIKIYGRKKPNRSDYKLYEIWFEFQEICNKENIDYIFTLCDIHAFGDLPNIKLPKIISWLPIHNDPLDIGTKTLLKNINFVLSTSLWGKNIIKQYNKNVEYVPHQIDSIFYNKISLSEKENTRIKLNIPTDYFCCLFVGRNTEDSNRKQFQRNILAFKKFKEKYNIEKCWLHLHTNLKGSVDFSELIDYSCMSVSDQDRLFSYDFSKDDIRKLYQMSDMLLCLSGSEGFGLPILEAQLSGIPVVATNCTAMSENVYNGFLVNCNNVENNNIESWSYANIDHASNCIFDVYSDNNKIVKSNIARDIISQKYSSKNISNNINNIFKNLENLKNDYIKCIIIEDNRDFILNEIKNSNKYNYLFLINPLKNKNNEEINFMEDIKIDYEKHNNIILITVDKFDDIYLEDYYYHYLYTHVRLGIDYLTSKNLNNISYKLNINNKNYLVDDFLKNNILNFIHTKNYGEILFENYLLKLRKILKEKKLKKIKNLKNCKYNAVFIDNQNLKYFDVILLNLILLTNDDIGFQIFYSENNKEYFKNIIQKNNLKNITMTKLNFNINNKLSYSDFLFSKEFYTNVIGEKVLMYNTDTLLLKNFNNIYFDYDWIGALWSESLLEIYNANDIFKNKLNIGSGNFNIRNIKKCKQISHENDYLLTKANKFNFVMREDLIYSYYLQEKNTIMPDINTVGNFSVQTVFNPNPMAIDNIYNYFINNQIEINYINFLLNNHSQKILEI